MTAQFALIVYLMGFIAYLIPIWYDEADHYGHKAQPGTWAMSSTPSCGR